MSFGSPFALLLLAIAVPIIVLYVLKVRLRRVPVSTNLFWKQIYEEKPPRSIWQYLRHLLSLLLQLALLALLVFAIADPFLPWQLKQARRTILVVDPSASMRATDVEPSRFSLALESAESLIEGIRAHDTMAIVMAGERPQVALGMTSHVPTLKSAVRDLQPSDGPTRLEPALELARKLIGDHPNGEIIVLTDGAGEATTAADAVDVKDSPSKSTVVGPDIKAATEKSKVIRKLIKPDYRVFAADRDMASNVGITQFQVRRSLVDPLGYEILAQVKNASSQPVSCRLEVELNGLPVDILPLDLKPEEVWQRSIEKTSLEGGHVAAKLTEIAAMDSRTQREENGSASNGDDGESDHEKKVTSSDTSSSSALNHLAIDDTAWAILPPREIQNVLIVTPGNLFLQKVFEANPLVSARVVNELPESWPANTLVVLHQLTPEKIPAGDVMIVDPDGSSDLWELGEELANPVITDQKSGSTLMTHVRLDNVLMPKARQLKPSVPIQVLAGGVSGDPIYAELMRPTGRCLVLTTDLDESDLAFRTAFPIMVSNALGWFAGTSGELNRSLATGEIAKISFRSHGETQVEIVSPNGDHEILPLGDLPTLGPGNAGTSSPNDPLRPITFGPLNSAGIYEVINSRAHKTEADSVPSLAEVAVNLANASESDLRASGEMRSRSNGQKVSAVGQWFSRPFWFYLAMVGCLLTLVEWGLYHRRFIE